MVRSSWRPNEPYQPNHYRKVADINCLKNITFVCVRCPTLYIIRLCSIKSIMKLDPTRGQWRLAGACKRLIASNSQTCVGCRPRICRACSERTQQQPVVFACGVVLQVLLFVGTIGTVARLSAPCYRAPSTVDLLAQPANVPLPPKLDAMLHV